MRKEPYTETGISRVTCCREGCENKASTQWQCCATGNKWMALCTDCDLALNELTMEFINHPDRLKQLMDYWASKGRTRAQRAVRAVLSNQKLSKKAMIAAGRALTQPRRSYIS